MRRNTYHSPNSPKYRNVDFRVGNPSCVCKISVYGVQSDNSHDSSDAESLKVLHTLSYVDSIRRSPCQIKEISDSHERDARTLRDELIENLKNQYQGSDAKALRDELIENLKNQYQGVMIKVDGVIHHLNRITLALKSDYFEKLLTGNFNEKESQLVEVNLIDGRMFSSIIELINGKTLISVINIDNYVDLLMAMDYFQMEIDLTVFRDLIIDNLKLPLKLNSRIFVLYDFIALQNKKFDYLLESVCGYLCIHLNEFCECREYLSLSADQLVKIIARKRFPEYTIGKNQIGLICAKWICHDLGNRVSHIVDLANAARFRYDIDHKVHLENVNISFPSSERPTETKLASVEKYFIRLLNLNGEIDPALENPEEHKCKNLIHIINQIDERKKWTEFLKNEYFYDVTIKSGEKIFKLHRFMLASSSDYFAHIFSTEISKAVQSGKRSTFLIDKDAEYLLEDIDPKTFQGLIELMYDVGDSLSELDKPRLLKGAIILRSAVAIAGAKSEIFFRLKHHHENIIELMNLTYGHEMHEEFYTTLLAHVVNTWPDIINTPEFHSTSIDVLESILTFEDLTIDEQKIMNICSKWISHDVKNRFGFLTRISVAINRSYMMDIEAVELEVPKDWDSCSEQLIRDRLWKILSSNTLVPSKTNVKSEESIGKPMFVAAKGQTLDILDANLEKIVSIPLGHSSSNKSANDKSQISATLIDDNLFIVYVTRKKSLFKVYNLSSKKLIQLSSDRRMKFERKITLLNCNGQVYCCSNDGLILRYVIELNRWTMFSEIKLNENDEIDQLVFASNGNTLFKISRFEGGRKGGIPKAYDFVNNSWNSLPVLPTHCIGFGWIPKISAATTFKGNLAILFPQEILLFDKQLKLWHQISIRHKSCEHHFEIFTQHEEGMLYTGCQEICYISAYDRQPVAYKDLSVCKNYSQFNTVHVVRK